MLKKTQKVPKIPSPAIKPHQIIHWKPYRLAGRFPKPIRPWLTDRHSLTAKLKQHCNDFNIQRLFEGWEQPLASEQQLLKLPDGQKVWTRCVLLQCQQHPLVYARSLIPNFGSGNPWLNIQQLGDQPLGELLFQLPNLHRSHFEFSQTQLAWPHLPQTFNHPPHYARRNLFWQQQSPLLLTEVFLEML